jgi:hydroxymethylbilane synthase
MRALFPGLPCAPVRGNIATRLSKLDGGGAGTARPLPAGLPPLFRGGDGSRRRTGRPRRPGTRRGRLLLPRRCPRPRLRSGGYRQTPFRPGRRGDCGSPAATYAKVSGGEIFLKALLAADGDAPVFRDTISGPREAGPALVGRLAEPLRKKAGLSWPSINTLRATPLSRSPLPRLSAREKRRKET